MKIALVVGSSGTLGSELINLFIDNHYYVYGIYNNHKSKISNDHLRLYKYDLNIEKDFKEIYRDLNKCSNIDSFVIVYASGLYSKCNIENFDSDEFLNYLNVNSIGFMNIYKKLFSFIKKCRITNIILIGTNLLKRKNKGSIYYNLSKSLLEQIAKQIAYEHGEYNVLINQICPGMFLSNMNENTSKDKMEIIKNNIPLKRVSDANEIAKFICNFGINNTFITGETIIIDGGNTIGY